MSYIYVVDNGGKYSDHIVFVFEHEEDFLEDLKTACELRGEYTVQWCAEARVLLGDNCGDSMATFQDVLSSLMESNWHLNDEEQKENDRALLALPKLGPMIAAFKAKRKAEYEARAKAAQESFQRSRDEDAKRQKKKGALQLAEEASVKRLVKSIRRQVDSELVEQLESIHARTSPE